MPSLLRSSSSDGAMIRSTCLLRHIFVIQVAALIGTLLGCVANTRVDPESRHQYLIREAVFTHQTSDSWRPTVLRNDNDLSGVAFLGEQRGFGFANVSDGCDFYSTSDGAETWSRINSVPGLFVTDMISVNKDMLLITATSLNPSPSIAENGSSIMISTDAGRNWKAAYRVEHGYLERLKHGPNQTLIAVGGGLVSVTFFL